jgi:phage shock protein C
MNKVNEHRKAGPYRSRNGVIFGVCKGLAEYFDFSVFWIRTAAVAILFFTGIWPIVGLYILASLIMKPEPVVPFSSEADQEFYNSFSSSRSMALQRLKRTFDSLDRRLQRMEDIVTTKEYDWTIRFNER